MSSRFAVVLSVMAVVLAIGAVTIEVTVSHGWADLLWFLATILLLVSSYALRRYARSGSTGSEP